MSNRITTDETTSVSPAFAKQLLAEVPVRIQRSRQRKQVSPNGLPIVYVGRGSRWGNPFRLCKLNNGKFAISHECDYQLHQITKKVGCDNKHYNTRDEAAIDAIKCYDFYLLPYTHKDGSMMDFYHSMANIDDAIMSLKGKNLSCWCPIIDKNNNYCVCHADLLLSLANNKSIDEIRKENIKTIIR